MNGLELIRHRRSVRTFDGTPLRREDAEKLLRFAQGIETPYGIPVSWKLLNAREDKLSSPVIVGTDTYIAGKLQRQPHAEEAFGYAFEKMVLYAEDLRLGTTWIAGTMDRPAFEKAMQLKADEVMPCVSPLGYPAKKMSLREAMMRKGIHADSRIAWPELFFDRSFDRPLSENTPFKDALEMVRWAPSAVNKQPWRVVVDGRQAHFYEKKSRGYVDASGWDLQKVDLGIAMCHFAFGVGERARLVIADPGIPSPIDTGYIATLIPE